MKKRRSRPQAPKQRWVIAEIIARRNDNTIWTPKTEILETTPMLAKNWYKAWVKKNPGQNAVLFNVTLSESKRAA